MQAGGRFVEHVKRFARRFFDQLACELDTLCLATGECWRGLSELHVVEPHRVERFELVLDLGNVLEVFEGLLHVHLEHVSNRLVLVLDLQVLRD